MGNYCLDWHQVIFLTLSSLQKWKLRPNFYLIPQKNEMNIKLNKAPFGIEQSRNYKIIQI